MQIIVLTLPAFLIALAGHFVWWRIRLPQRRLAALLNCFLLVFLVTAFGMFFVRTGPPPLPQILRATLFYWALVCAYTITYSTYVEFDSVTLSLMRLIGQRRDGVTVEQVEQVLASRPFVAARIEALKKAGVIVESDGKLIRSGRPPLVFRVFLFWRRWLRVVEATG